MGERIPSFDEGRMEPLMNAAAKSAPLLAGVAGLGVLGYGALRYGDTAVPWYNVVGGQRAVVYNRIFGVDEVVKEEGMHPKMPWFDRPTIFNVKYEPYLLRSMSGSRDLQMVDMQLRVLCRPIPSELPRIFKDIGADYREKVLPSIVNEVLKSEVAKHNATQLITNREQVSQEIKAVLSARAVDFGMQVQDVSITHLAFSDEYTRSVESKQVAQQEAERAKYIVDRAKQEAMSIKIKANGEAEAATRIGDAMKENPGFLQLRRIEAARDIAQVVSKSANHIYLDAGTLLLNLGGHSSGVDGGAESKGKRK